MIKAVFFDFGHTIMDEIEHRDAPVAARPIVLMPEVLQTLPLITFDMGILNNTKTATEADVRQWLERAGINRYFKWVFTSFDLGYRKPSKEFFDLTLTKSGLKKEEIVFVGNQLNTDIAGANSYEIKNVYILDKRFRSPDDTETLANVKPTYTIEKLIDLPNLLSTI